MTLEAEPVSPGEALSGKLSGKKSAKFYSISVDSTPDISHVDQLTCVVRYVLPSGPTERFLTFLQPQRHTGEELGNTLVTFLQEHSISIEDCRGQS